jgi:hypothetical protein
MRQDHGPVAVSSANDGILRFVVPVAERTKVGQRPNRLANFARDQEALWPNYTAFLLRRQQTSGKVETTGPAPKLQQTDDGMQEIYAQCHAVSVRSNRLCRREHKRPGLTAEHNGASDIVLSETTPRHWKPARFSHREAIARRMRAGIHCGIYPETPPMPRTFDARAYLDPVARGIKIRSHIITIGISAN